MVRSCSGDSVYTIPVHSASQMLGLLICPLVGWQETHHWKVGDHVGLIGGHTTSGGGS